MNKFFYIVLLLLTMMSCSVEDNEQEYVIENMPVESVFLPQTFVFGQTYSVTMTYNRPSTCHGYDGILYTKEGNVRTFAIQNIVVTGDFCENLTDELAETTFDITINEMEPYLLKFWQGTNDSGEDVFLEYEIMVVTN